MRNTSGKFVKKETEKTVGEPLEPDAAIIEMLGIRSDEKPYSPEELEIIKCIPGMVATTCFKSDSEISNTEALWPRGGLIRARSTQSLIKAGLLPPGSKHPVILNEEILKTDPQDDFLYYQGDCVWLETKLNNKKRRDRTAKLAEMASKGQPQGPKMQPTGGTTPGLAEFEVIPTDDRMVETAIAEKEMERVAEAARRENA